MTFVLNIDDGQDLLSANVDISYDPTVLNYDAFRPGSPCGGVFDECAATDKGSSVSVAASFLDPLPAGSVALAELDFLVLASAPRGPSSLTPNVTGLSAWPGYPLGEPGSVSPDDVTASGATITIIPLPPAWLLALSGMTCLWWLRGPVRGIRGQRRLGSDGRPS